jgi:putative hydrolase
VLDRVTAFMSLVEGHAEWVMNAVSPTVIPSQQVIESRFAARRRKGGNPLDRLVRRLLGMEAKTRQYVDGSAFVRAVVDRVGVPGFNAIWTSRETLPTKAEISDPSRWIARVHA